MPRVFLLERSRRNFDISSADEFGDVVHVFTAEDRRTSPFNVGHYLDQVVEQLEAKDFDPRIDFLCVAGSLIPLTMAIVAALRKWKTIRVLLFSAPECRYLERTLSIQETVDDTSDVSSALSHGEGAA